MPEGGHMRCAVWVVLATWRGHGVWRLQEVRLRPVLQAVAEST